MTSVRILIWIYFLLLIFEGALRKWILPGLATPLLMVRDPVLLAAYFLAAARGLFPLNLWNSLLILLATAAYAAALFPGFGHGNWRIASFGFRCLFAHLPLIFLMVRVFDLRHVLAFGRATLWLSIPMTTLLVMQFYSPTDAWVNTGLGGEGTSTFSGAMGYSRCSGTFSFTQGVTLFYTLAIAFFAISFSLDMKVSTPVRIASGLAILLAMPVSLSRSLVLGGGFVGLVAILIYSRGGFAAKVLPRIVFALIALSVVAFSTQVGRDSILAFADRWTTASSASEGGVVDAVGGRLLDTFTAPFEHAMNVPELGYGLGLGTTFGALEYFGVRAFLLGENEWERIIKEIGPFLGFFYIAYRVGLFAYALKLGLKCMREDNPAPLILLSSCALQIMTAQTGQATSLGFMVISAGLTLAAAKLPPGAKLVETKSKVSLPFHPDLPVPRPALAGAGAAGNGGNVLPEPVSAPVFPAYAESGKNTSETPCTPSS